MVNDFSKFNASNEKSVMFFSASSYKDAELILDSGITELLVSYFYLRKNIEGFEHDILPRCKYFMTDSGGHSFLSAKKIDDSMYTAKYWEPFIEEYIAWCSKHFDKIYCMVNMDLEDFVGKEVVDKWNTKYFKPLEKYTNVVYVAHQDSIEGDKDGAMRFREYCKLHQYVGVNNDLYEHANKFVQIAKQYGRRIHGFGWTSIPTLKRCPFFSVDSTTWLGGVRYGTTYDYDGKNFRVLAYKKKFKRKTKKIECREKGIDYDGLMKEVREPVNLINLEGWKGARHEIMKMAALKLSTKPIKYYDKRS